MEIEIKENEELTFKDLKVGDTFSDCEDPGGGDVYLVLDEDHGLGNGEEDDFDGYAVNLLSGYIYGFCNTDEVYRLRVKCTASRC